MASLFHEKCVGKKFVYSNCFKIFCGKQNLKVVPLYDHYKVSFPHCDKLNQQMNMKTWPYRYGGGNRSEIGGKLIELLLHLYPPQHIQWSVRNHKNPCLDYELQAGDEETVPGTCH